MCVLYFLCQSQELHFTCSVNEREVLVGRDMHMISDAVFLFPMIAHQTWLYVVFDVESL